MVGNRGAISAGDSGSIPFPTPSRKTAVPGIFGSLRTPKVGRFGHFSYIIKCWKIRNSQDAAQAGTRLPSEVRCTHGMGRWQYHAHQARFAAETPSRRRARRQCQRGSPPPSAPGTFRISNRNCVPATFPYGPHGVPDVTALATTEPCVP